MSPDGDQQASGRSRPFFSRPWVVGLAGLGSALAALDRALRREFEFAVMASITAVSCFGLAWYHWRHPPTQAPETPEGQQKAQPPAIPTYRHYPWLVPIASLVGLLIAGWLGYRAFLDAGWSPRAAGTATGLVLILTAAIIWLVFRLAKRSRARSGR